jgi:excisionase family DNA binding protein
MKNSNSNQNGNHNHSEAYQAPPSPPRKDGFEPLLDSEEAAALLKIHPKTLQKLARNGEVDAIQIGKLWRFRASALNRWLEKIAS